MSIPTDNFIRLSGDEKSVNDALGPLAGLAGKWVGKNGWNLIAFPSPGSKPDDEGEFGLLIQPYYESLTFTPIGAPVRNRGGISEQYIGGLSYEQTVHHAETDETLHVENGLWLNLDTTLSGDDYKVPFPICRTASIPHGDSAMILGHANIVKGAPDFEKTSAEPPEIGDAPLGYTEPYYLQSRDIAFDPGDLNAVHRERLESQKVIETTHFKLDSENGGGVLNIPFVKKYVDMPRFQADFWLESVITEEGFPIQQLQYTQVIDMFFHKQFGKDELINWPHVNVNTVVKV